MSTMSRRHDQPSSADVRRSPWRVLRLTGSLAGVALAATACLPHSITTPTKAPASQTTSRTPAAEATHPTTHPKPAELSQAKQYAAAMTYLMRSGQLLPAKIVLPKTITDPAIRQITTEAKNFQLADEIANSAVSTPVSQASTLPPEIAFITDPQLQHETRQAVADGLSYQYISGLSDAQPDNLDELDGVLGDVLGPGSASYTQITDQLGLLQGIGSTYQNDIVNGYDATKPSSQLNQAAGSAFNAAKQINNEFDVTARVMVSTIGSHIPGYHDPTYGP